jgi:predicted nucleic acid-binding protein
VPEIVSAKNPLESDPAVIHFTDEVLLACVRLLETNPLRSSDAIQIASALAWHSDMFVSADPTQCAAAKTADLSVAKL